MSATTRNWVLDTVKKLPHDEIEQLKNYLESLICKSQQSTEGVSIPQNISETESKGKPEQILQALNKSHEVSIEDAEVLLQSIKEGEIPIRFKSTFDKSAGK